MRAFYSNRLIKHGLTAMLVGLLGGFLLAFSMVGGASISPLPVFFQFELPGPSSGWRILHVGTLMNGIMALAIGLVMRTVYISDIRARRIFLSFAIAIWGNFSFYLFGMFAPNHGLSIEANRLGEASLAGAMAYIPAILAAVTSIWATAVLLLSEPEYESSGK
jgi:tetrahydromethanopterin S-methyltransferase subunit F